MLKKLLMAEFKFLYTHTANGKMIPVETIPGMGIGGRD
jgi:hypothetical protein